MGGINVFEKANMQLLLFLLSLLAFAASLRGTNAHEKSVLRGVSNPDSWYTRDGPGDCLSSDDLAGHKLLAERTCDAIFGMRAQDAHLKRYRLWDYDSFMHERFPLDQESDRPRKNNLVVFYNTTMYMDELESNYEYAAASIYSHLVSGAFRRGDYVTLMYGPYIDKREQISQTSVGNKYSPPSIGLKIMRAEDACYALAQGSKGKSLIRDVFKISDYDGPMKGWKYSSMRLLVSALQKFSVFAFAREILFDCESSNLCELKESHVRLENLMDMQLDYPDGRRPTNPEIARPLSFDVVVKLENLFKVEDTNTYMLVFYDPAADSLTRYNWRPESQVNDQCVMERELDLTGPYDKYRLFQIFGAKDALINKLNIFDLDEIVQNSRSPGKRIYFDLSVYNMQDLTFSKKELTGLPMEFSINGTDTARILVRFEDREHSTILHIKMRLLLYLSKLRVRYFLAMGNVSEHIPVVANEDLYSKRYLNTYPDAFKHDVSWPISTRCRGPLFDASVSYGRPNLVQPGLGSIVKPLQYLLPYSQGFSNKGVRGLSTRENYIMNLMPEYDVYEPGNFYFGNSRIIGRTEQDLYGVLANSLKSSTIFDKPKHMKFTYNSSGSKVQAPVLVKYFDPPPHIPNMIGLSRINFIGDSGEFDIRESARHYLFQMHFGLTHSNFYIEKFNEEQLLRLNTRANFMNTSHWRELDMYDFIFNKRCPGAGSTVSQKHMKFPFYCSSDDASNYVSSGVYTWYIPPACGSRLPVDAEMKGKLIPLHWVDFNCVTKATTYDPNPLCPTCGSEYVSAWYGMCSSRVSKEELRPMDYHPSIEMRFVE